MNVRSKNLLALFLGAVSVISLDWVAYSARWMSFENPDPPLWSTFVTCWNLSALIVPAAIVGLIMDRHQAIAGAAIGALRCMADLWQSRHTFIPVGEYLPEAKFVPAMIHEVFMIILVTALIAAFMGWRKLKWTARRSEALRGRIAKR